MDLLPSMPPNKRETFDFFGLPQELRDSIFDKTLTYEKQLPPEPNRKVTVQNLPVKHLLLINHQFRRELLKRVRKLAFVRVEDQAFTGALEWPRKLFGVPHIRHVEMHLVLPCTPSDHEFRCCRVLNVVEKFRHHKAVMLLGDVRSETTISLNLYLEPHKHSIHCKDELLRQQEKISRTMKNGRLEDLNVYLCNANPNGDSIQKPRSTLLLAGVNVMLWRKRAKRILKYSRKDAKLQLVIDSEGKELQMGSMETAS